MFIHFVILLSYAIAWYKRKRDASMIAETEKEESIAETFFDDTIEEYLNGGNELTHEDFTVYDKEDFKPAS